jgi:hypothetical protein
MDILLDVHLRPTASPHLWVLFDSDGRVLLTDSLDEICRAVLYLQAKFTIEGVVER